ncbi:hypothetical protein ACHAXA_000384 [Cyclostephanos tholiformis]|uniref:Uncharacterized protein n=1 Tax=Cyclostephanos tholiformis TaxID=382380 RepID=A0ABD3R402_9STRA
MPNLVFSVSIDFSEILALFKAQQSERFVLRWRSVSHDNRRDRQILTSLGLFTSEKEQFADCATEHGTRHHSAPQSSTLDPSGTEWVLPPTLSRASTSSIIKAGANKCDRGRPGHEAGGPTLFLSVVLDRFFFPPNH